ncbi:MAG: tRNA (adenosine(37)-N6)-dimethylallyltransferase MiaA [Flavihumibacter sp.]
MLPGTEYRGSAPSAGELAAVPHHFIASHSIFEPVTAAGFAQWALEKASALFASHDDIVMVGGTGLYIRAFAFGLDEMPPSSAPLRASLQEAYESRGLTWLQSEIGRLDPLYASAGEMQNPHRLLRALEVFHLTGKSIRSFQSGAVAERPFDMEWTLLDLPREQLYARINNRVDAMMAAGLLDEVRELVAAHGFQPGRLPQALQTVGYTELIYHLAGRLSLDAAVEQIKTSTRHYAKRQLTWFRKFLPPVGCHPTGIT